MVSDQCSDRGTKSMMKLNSLVARMEARSTNFDSNFESDWEHKLQRASPIVRLGKAGFVKVGTHSLFRCCEGLGHLIKRGGKPNFACRFGTRVLLAITSRVPPFSERRDTGLDKTQNTASSAILLLRCKGKTWVRSEMQRGSGRGDAMAPRGGGSGQHLTRGGGHLGGAARRYGHGQGAGRGFSGRFHGGENGFSQGGGRTGSLAEQWGRGFPGYRPGFSGLNGEWRRRHEQGSRAEESRLGSDLQRKRQPQQGGGISSRGKDMEAEGSQHQSNGNGGGDVTMTDAGASKAEMEVLDAKSGIRCLRCAKKGHVAATCNEEIYCVICDHHNDQVNHRCPILKQLKPVAHAVGYAVHGLGFYHIPHPPLPKAKRESKKVLISVSEGVLNKDQIQTELQRIFPRKWQWEIKEHDDNSFIAEFPKKIEKQRAVAFGGADVRAEGVPSGMRLKFEEWREKE